jgi:peptidoglycan/LPS O-acetylase OafA/YrhL
MNRKTVPKILDKKYFNGLDVLRAFSLVLVVISHVLFNDDGTIGKMHLGTIGVDVFFVISGFLITTLICKEIAANGQFDLRAFFIRRAFRILPVVFLFTIVLFFLNHFYSLNISSSSLISGLLFYRNFPYIQGVWENGHLWSLSVEEQFYIVFPTFLFLLKENIYFKFLLIFLIAIPGVDYLHYNSLLPEGLFNKFIAIFANIFSKGTYMIIIGSLGALLVFKNERFFNFIYNSNCKIFWSIFSLTFITVLSTNSYLTLSPFVSRTILGIGVFVIIILNLSREKIELLFWDNPILIYLGKLSYSLYIWQQLFTYKQPWGGGILLNLICLLLVSIISYHLIEMNFIKLRKSLGY